MSTNGYRCEANDEKLKADLVSVFEVHGWTNEEVKKFAADAVGLANGAVLAHLVPVIGTADRTV